MFSKRSGCGGWLVLGCWGCGLGGGWESGRLGGQGSSLCRERMAVKRAVTLVRDSDFGGCFGKRAGRQ